MDLLPELRLSLQVIFSPSRVTQAYQDAGVSLAMLPQSGEQSPLSLVLESENTNQEIKQVKQIIKIKELKVHRECKQFKQVPTCIHVLEAFAQACIPSS